MGNDNRKGHHNRSSSCSKRKHGSEEVELKRERNTKILTTTEAKCQQTKRSKTNHGCSDCSESGSSDESVAGSCNPNGSKSRADEISSIDNVSSAARTKSSKPGPKSVNSSGIENQCGLWIDKTREPRNLNLEDSKKGKHMHVLTWINGIPNCPLPELDEDVEIHVSMKDGTENPIVQLDDRKCITFVTPGAPETSEDLRPVIIDGNSVAWWHGNRVRYSADGIRVCVKFFKTRGHTSIIVLIPDLRSLNIIVHNKEVLEALRKDGILKYIPNRIEDGNRIALLASHDNRKYILQNAAQRNAVVVSNDDYQVLREDARESWLDTLDSRIVNFVFTSPEEIKFQSDRELQKKAKRE